MPTSYKPKAKPVKRKTLFSRVLGQETHAPTPRSPGPFRCCLGLLQKHLHTQLLESHAKPPIKRAILRSQSAPPPPPTLVRISCNRTVKPTRLRTVVFVSVARRLVLPHPAASDPSSVVLACPSQSAAGQICGKPVDPPPAPLLWVSVRRRC